MPIAGVGDGDADIIAGRQRRRVRGHAVEPRIGGGDGEPAAIRHGVAGVDGEIEQRAFQLVGIAQRAPQIVRRDDRKIDGLADGPAQQILQRHHQLIGIDAFRNQRLPPRKRQQAMGERRGAVGRCHRRVDVARDVVGAPLIETGLQQIQRSDDAGQQIVEVVRDAAGQLPHRFHLLGLQQRLLGGLQPLGRGLLRGDVAGDRIDVIPVRHAGPRQPAVRSVLVAKAAFEPDGGFALRRACSTCARVTPSSSGCSQPFRGAVEQFGLAPAERSGPGRVDRSPDAVAIGDQQKVLRHVPDPVALAGLFLDALRQRRIQFGELAGNQLVIMDIGVGADPADDLALLVARRHRPRQKPPERAVGAAQAEFDFVGFAAADRLRPHRDRGRKIVGVDDLAPLIAVEFAGTGARIFINARIEPVQQSVGPRGPDVMRHGFGERAEFLFALPQRLLGHHLLGDIGVRADQADGLAVRVALDGGSHRNPARLAVARTNDPVLHGVFANLARDGIAEFLFGGFAILGMDAPDPVLVGFR